MKYAEKFPGARLQEFPSDEPGLAVGHSSPCYQCHEETPFVDTDLEEAVCSEECREGLTRKFYAEDKALREQYESLERGRVK